MPPKSENNKRIDKNIVVNMGIINYIVLLAFLVINITSCDKNDEPALEEFVELPGSIDGNLYRFGVNTNPYEYFHVYETPVPAGFSPFYISGYLRHGSRGNNGVDYSPTVEAFTRMHEAGVLNEEGERVFRQIMFINSKDNGIDANLTQLGAQEHRQIANRLCNKYRSMFMEGSLLVRAVSTEYPRCIESMGAFTNELSLHYPHLIVSTNSGDQFKYLSSGSPKDVTVKVAEIKSNYDSMYMPDTVYFASHLFTNRRIANEVADCSISTLMSGTISFAAISGAFELDETLLNVFNIEDLKHYARSLSLYLYLTQCNSIEFGERRMSRLMIGALIDDFIEKADSTILNNDCVADLRFGHDSHLLAFCSKIGVEGIGERLTSEEAAYWPGWLYSPFAGNFYMVFYKNHGGQILVKCFLNEREASIIGLSGGPYYTWDEFKQYLKSR